VSFTVDSFSVALMEGRTISVPLAWYPRLLHASKEQLTNWKIIGGGGTATTGWIWTKIWALKASCVGRPHLVIPPTPKP